MTGLDTELPGGRVKFTCRYLPTDHSARLKSCSSRGHTDGQRKTLAHAYMQPKIAHLDGQVTAKHRPRVTSPSTWLGLRTIDDLYKFIKQKAPWSGSNDLRARSSRQKNSHEHYRYLDLEGLLRRPSDYHRIAN